MLTRGQISLIHVAKTRLGLSDDDYHAMLNRAAGVTSAKQLDNRGFDLVMKEFERLGFKNTSRKKPFGFRDPRMATDAQVAKIRRLWGEYTDQEGTDLTLGKWLDWTFKVSALRFLPRESAPKAIYALKQMGQKKHSKNEAAKAG